MIVGYGVTVPKGSLPAFSVGSRKEAKALIVSACPRTIKGQYVAPELVKEQTLDNLEAFGDRLRKIHDQYFAGTERCDCKKGPGNAKS